MMVDTPQVKNLNNPEYIKILLKGNADLTGRFAEIDIKQVRQALSEEQKNHLLLSKENAEAVQNIGFIG